MAFGRWRWIWLIAGFLGLCSAVKAAPPLDLCTNDVLVFLGEANMVASQETGHLETLLTVRFQGQHIRFRNLAWEGDTVYAQPRDFKFPSLRERLIQAGATVLVLDFGQAEALAGQGALASFSEAYEQLVSDLSRTTPRIFFLTPVPFQKSDPLLPDLTLRNADLSNNVDAVRDLAVHHRWRVTDLHAKFERVNPRPNLTTDGMHLTPRGQGELALMAAADLGLSDLVSAAGALNTQAAWGNPAFQRLRQAIIAKNKVWFDYSRPMNWAFLGGDRTEQPSSRDHRDPHVRWFPAEMEQFVPLLDDAERKVEGLAQGIMGGHGGRGAAAH